MQRNLEQDVRREASHPGRMGLVLLAFSAVLREGVELSVFLLAAQFSSDPGGTFAGAVTGLLAAVLMGWILFATTRKLPIRQFFLVTNILLILFASGLVAHGIHELNEAGWVHPLVENIWNINYLLDEQSIPGELLKALFGYNGNPSLSEVLAYFLYFGALLLLIRLVVNRPPARAQGADPA
jgi:high-affinity iron transporter